MAQFNTLTTVSGNISCSNILDTHEILTDNAMPIGAIQPIHQLAPVPDTEFWHPCDGTAYSGVSILGGNSPNLTSRYLQGTNIFGAGIGSANTFTITENNLPSHNHSVGASASLLAGTTVPTAAADSHNHTLSTATQSIGGLSGVPSSGHAGTTRATTSTGSSHNHNLSHDHGNIVSSISSSLGNPTISLEPSYYEVKLYIRWQ